MICAATNKTPQRRHNAPPLPKNSIKRSNAKGLTAPQAAAESAVDSLGSYLLNRATPPPAVSYKSESDYDFSAAAEAARKDRFYRQDIAQTILFEEKRLNACCKALAPDRNIAAGIAGQVKIMQTATAAGNAYHLKGLVTCGSVWTCPVCSARVSERRKDELSAAVDGWTTSGHGVTMATLTSPHYSNTQLDEHLAGMKDALRRMTNRKPFKRIAEQIGIVGRVRALEVTHGVNGWHSHFHILLFTDAPLDSAALPELQTELLNQWKSACVAAGLPEPNAHGFTLAAGNSAAGEYVSKWGACEEMTKGINKTGQRDGQVTPFGLLLLHAGGDATAAPLFREYAKCFKGSRQLVWTAGLRDLLGLGAELSDEELAEMDEEKAVEFMTIPLNVWKTVLRRRARGALLAACLNGIDSVYDFLIEIMPDE